MKNKLIKILAFILLLAVSSETVSGIWANNEHSVVILEKEEKNNTREGEKEKEESNEKFFQELSLFQESKNNCVLFVLNHIHFKYSAYLSLPEIPPDFS